LQALRFILIALSLGGTTISAATETVDGRRIVIIDGDTIDVRGERIRRSMPAIGSLVEQFERLAA
jgi:hypothetical protein